MTGESLAGLVACIARFVIYRPVWCWHTVWNWFHLCNGIIGWLLLMASLPMHWDLSFCIIRILTKAVLASPRTATALFLASSIAVIAASLLAFVKVSLASQFLFRHVCRTYLPHQVQSSPVVLFYKSFCNRQRLVLRPIEEQVGLLCWRGEAKLTWSRLLVLSWVRISIRNQKFFFIF